MCGFIALFYYDNGDGDVENTIHIPGADRPPHFSKTHNFHTFLPREQKKIGNTIIVFP